MHGADLLLLLPDAKLFLSTANIAYATVHLAWRNATRHKQAVFMMV